MIAPGAVAPDTDPDGAGRATLTLRLPNAMEDALFDAFEVPIGAAQVIEGAGDGVLDIHILAAATLQDEAHLDLRLFPLLEVQDGRARTEVVALFLPVMESTELGRSLPRLVASARASRICFFSTS